MARAQHGDVQAYEVLVCRYQELAVRAAYVIVGDQDAARDAAQAGFIKAYYALPRFRAREPFRPWLLRIVVNEARNQVRAAQRRSGYELQFERGRLRDDAASSPETSALAMLTREAVLRAVNALPEKDREIIACRYFLDLSEAEVADILRCPRGTVKSRLSRAIARLRELLATEPSDAQDQETRHG